MVNSKLGWYTTTTHDTNHRAIPCVHIILPVINANGFGFHQAQGIKGGETQVSLFGRAWQLQVHIPRQFDDRYRHDYDN